MSWRRILALLAVLVLAAAACGEGGTAEPESEQTEESEDGEEGTIQIAGEDATDHGTEDVSGASSVEVELDDFYFGPTVLSGTAGQTLTVELHNEGAVAHTFTVGDVDVELQAGESGEAEVTFPERGALLVVCRFHEGGGMRAGLSVGGDLEAAPGQDGSASGEDDSGGEDSGGGRYGGGDDD